MNEYGGVGIEERLGMTYASACIEKALAFVGYADVQSEVTVQLQIVCYL